MIARARADRPGAFRLLIRACCQRRRRTGNGGDTAAPMATSDAGGLLHSNKNSTGAQRPTAPPIVAETKK